MKQTSWWSETIERIEANPVPSADSPGIVAAANMTPEQKADRARKGAMARWGNKMPTATHKGNFVSDFGVDAECYVLDDERKTAVMTQRGIGAALGLSNPGGKDFERLVGGKILSEYLGAEVLAKIAQPIEFKWVYPGAKQATTTIKAYGADILIDVANAILAAEASGKLREQQANLAKQSRVILNASAKSGITNLVYALAGYRPEQARTPGPPPKTGPCWAFRSTLLFFTPPVQKSVASMPSGCAARSWTQSRESFFRPAKSMPTALGGSNA